MHGGLPGAMCNNTFNRRSVSRVELCARVDLLQRADARELRSMGKKYMCVVSTVIKIKSLPVLHSPANMTETGTDIDSNT